jgi:hypothetical protein
MSGMRRSLVAALLAGRGIQADFLAATLTVIIIS